MEYLAYSHKHARRFPVINPYREATSASSSIKEVLTKDFLQKLDIAIEKKNKDLYLQILEETGKKDFFIDLMETTNSSGLLGYSYRGKKAKSHEGILYAAYQKGNFDIVDCLFKQGFPLQPKLFEMGIEALHVACLGGSIQIIRLLLENGSSVSRATTKKSALCRETLQPAHIACYKGNDEVLELLLNNGADIEAKTYYNENCLSIALRNQHWSIVEMLLDRGVNVETITGYSESKGPLGIIFEDCCSFQCKPHPLDSVKEKKPIPQALLKRIVEMVAVEIGHLDLSALRRLCQSYPTALEAKTQDGDTPLHERCCFALDDPRDMSAIRFMTEKSPGLVQTRNNAGRLPLHHALTFLGQEAEPVVVELLLKEFGAGALMPDNKGLLPLHVGCSRGDSWGPYYKGGEFQDYLVDPFIRKIKLLIEHNPEVLMIPDHLGNLPLHLAAGRNVPPELIELLVKENRRALEMRNNRGRLPLHEACIGYEVFTKRSPLPPYNESEVRLPLNTSFIILAKEYPAALRERDRDHNTPLHIALSQNAPKEKIEFLLHQYPEALNLGGAHAVLPLAATKCCSSVDCIYNLLRQNPGVVDATKNVKEKRMI